MVEPKAVTPHSLLEFVLRTAQVRTNVSSLQQWETGYMLLPRTVPDYNFIYCTRGQIVWEIEGQPYELPVGGLALVPPGVPHRGYSRTRIMTLLSIHVELLLPGGRDALALLAPPRFVMVPRDSALDRYLLGAQAEYARGDEAQTKQMLPGWAHMIVHEFLRFCAGRGELRGRPLTPVVAEVLDHLQQRRFSGSAITLEELSHFSGYTPQHLNRLFHRELGTTPLKHLTAMRLEDAARLLAEGKLTVAAVSRRCGFADAAYFSRVFRQHFGVSPAAYQRGSESPSHAS